MEKKKDNYAFGFQEFIAENEIKLKDLPKSLRKRIKAINEIEQRVRENCTPIHYKVIKSDLRDLAHEVQDDLEEEFQDRIKNNELPEENRPAVLKAFEKKLRAYLKNHPNHLISSEQLEALGFQVSALKGKRAVLVGNFAFQRGLATDLWKVLKKEEVAL